MNGQNTELVTNRSTRLQFRNAKQKEPMLGHAIPHRPWQKISLKFFELDSYDFLVLTDYYCKFLEILKLPSTTTSTVIKHLKPQFARYGIPDEVISNNWPQFFTNKSSQKYPPSNGQAERTVQSAYSRKRNMTGRFRT